MLYKTIVLELLQERQEYYEQLRSSKRLLPAMDAYAASLKASHEAWTDRLDLMRPAASAAQTSSEALELAIEELKAGLPSGPETDGIPPLSLDAAMSFIRRHTPPA